MIGSNFLVGLIQSKLYNNHYNTWDNIENGPGLLSVGRGSEVKYYDFFINENVTHVYSNSCVSMINSFSVETVFTHHILTTKDGPRSEGIKKIIIGIQMKRKEPTKTFMMISN